MYISKITACLAFIMLTGVLIGQNERALAKNYESYTAMFKDKKYRMVRNHAEFKTYAMNDKTLKKYLTAKNLNRFLTDLVFSKEGLVAFKYGYLVDAYPEQEKEIFAALARSFGWEPGPLGVDYSGYYCAAPDCKSTTNAICIGDNCGSSSIMTGKDFMEGIR